jgi:hypothetical protein
LRLALALIACIWTSAAGAFELQTLKLGSSLVEVRGILDGAGLALSPSFGTTDASPRAVYFIDKGPAAQLKFCNGRLSGVSELIPDGMQGFLSRSEAEIRKRGLAQPQISSDSLGGEMIYMAWPVTENASLSLVWSASSGAGTGSVILDAPCPQPDEARVSAAEPGPAPHVGNAQPQSPARPGEPARTNGAVAPPPAAAQQPRVAVVPPPAPRTPPATQAAPAAASPVIAPALVAPAPLPAAPAAAAVAPAAPQVAPAPRLPAAAPAAPPAVATTGQPPVPATPVSPAQAAPTVPRQAVPLVARGQLPPADGVDVVVPLPDAPSQLVVDQDALKQDPATGDGAGQSVAKGGEKPSVPPGSDLTAPVPERQAGPPPQPRSRPKALVKQEVAPSRRVQRIRPGGDSGVPSTSAVTPQQTPLQRFPYESTTEDPSETNATSPAAETPRRAGATPEADAAITADDPQQAVSVPPVHVPSAPKPASRSSWKPRTVEACAAAFRSYDRAAQTYRSTSGKVEACP